jgi:hypothetical protein
VQAGAVKMAGCLSSMGGGPARNPKEVLVKKIKINFLKV